jgi:hypothetical protein
MDHKAGPELDAAVAEKIMGWKSDGRWWAGSKGLTDSATTGFEVGESRYRFSPSEFIDHAWLVVEKLQEDRSIIRVEGQKSRWEVTILHAWAGTPPKDYVPPSAKAPTAPLAICLAALKARGL